MKASPLHILPEEDLYRVQKPAQYLGDEQNSIVKRDHEVDLHFAFAFPDAYEVGMSHLGMQILYEVINSDPKAWAERVFMPLPDMEELLLEKSVPLTSLEAKRPLREFDILGFTLQYELCGTNILAMLELSHIPMYSEDRKNDDPIVIAGGPYSYHPEALAPFIDAFFLGDAEEGIHDIISAVRKSKVDGQLDRDKALDFLSQIEGVYIPNLYKPVYDSNGELEAIQPENPEKATVTRRLLATMEGAPYNKKPVVPNIRTVHNRLSIEVMRGCVRGCRFCQAGYLYRPQRERSPKEISEMIQASLPETGFEELSLLSLSTADYCSVVPLLKSLMDEYGGGDRLAISFPSTRVDSLTPEVLEQVQRVRRTGFTVAPEAGTQRLRDVINKGVSDEQILETCSNVFRMGWTGIKLYFMLGLPTETDEDLQGIVDIAARIKALPVATGKDITVSVSTHVPKPHTPFQWAEQISPEETIRRQRFLADGLRKVRVNFRYHDAFSSFLEGVFCRADRRLAKVIVRAYQLGCRLDGWSEHLKEELWSQAFKDCDVDPYYFLRERGLLETLPWDHLSCGIPKSYFAKEWKRALRDRETPDCLTRSCSVCGACDYDVSKNILWPRDETEKNLNISDEPRDFYQAQAPVSRVRVEYEKKDAYRFVGHLELSQVVQRSCRRAELPLAYSAGFHPMPRISFGPPLQLGIGSSSEFADLYLSEPMSPETIRERLNVALPTGIRLKSAHEILLREPSIQAELASQSFFVQWLTRPEGLVGEQLECRNATEDLLPFLGELSVVRQVRAKSKKKYRTPRKKKAKEFILRDFLSKLELSNDSSKQTSLSDLGYTSSWPALDFTLSLNPQTGGPKPIEVVATLSGLNVGEFVIDKTATVFRVDMNCGKSD